MTGTADFRTEAIADHFRSVDSAPAGYAVDRPASAANGFLVTFAALAIIVMCVRTYLMHTGIDALSRDLVLTSRERGDVVFPLRMFLVVFFVTYAVFAYSNRWRRLFIAGALLGKFVVFCVVTDAGAWILHDCGLVSISTFGLQMASGLAALALFPHTLLRQAHLPRRVPMPTSAGTPVRELAIWFGCLAASILVTVLLVQVLIEMVDTLKDWAVLGGLGAGVFLVQQLFALSTAWFGVRRLRRSREAGAGFGPALAVLVPAHNEAHSIAATILSVDEAAAGYPGDIRIYVVNNASTDTTHLIAQEAIDGCVHLTGVVLECPIPGKAIALNLGIDHIVEDFIVRIDADTVIGPGSLTTAMTHFVDPAVGSVGGLPLPRQETTWIDKVRLVEVYMRHGFFQVSLDGYLGVLGVPGMFTVYRREPVVAVGGMVQGMNGEDTDICIRLTAAGFRCISDPAAVYHSETPASYAHLREQRTRWFRSIYHLAARNREMLFDRRSMTGTFVLPFQLVNAARRAMLGPLLLFAFLAEMFFHATFSTMRWQPVVATLLGMSMFVTILVCLLWRPSSVKYIPAYLVFRVLRSYFTLLAALTLVYPSMHPPRLWFRADRTGWPPRSLRRAS
ncbi:glycosyltransferase [Rhodococcus yananensis]|uniref:glycosyltransferase n=1 Tax=Rhodococcus yananensis TaxID=2879464 RepID=UPI001CF8BC05|nr:glycosyltransferase [Rhodococcus yananensis]